MCHEIKHDGYRLIVRRAGDTVRLFTRRGHDWTERYPAIAIAATKLRLRWTASRPKRTIEAAGGLPIVGFTGKRSYASIARRARPTAWVNNYETRLSQCCWCFRGGRSYDCRDPRVVGLLAV
jgi:ATP-dependent DNA ligase